MKSCSGNQVLVPRESLFIFDERLTGFHLTCNQDTKQ